MVETIRPLKLHRPYKVVGYREEHVGRLYKELGHWEGASRQRFGKWHCGTPRSSSNIKRSLFILQARTISGHFAAFISHCNKNKDITGDKELYDTLGSRDMSGL